MLVQSAQVIHLLPYHSQQHLQLSSSGLLEEKFLLPSEPVHVNLNNPVDKLPSEIILRTFKLLDIPTLVRASKVCRSWNEIAFDGSLWDTINLIPYYKYITGDRLIDLACTAGDFLKNINFRGCSQLTSQGLRDISDSCRNIQNIHLHGCHSLNRDSLIYFIEKCTDLRILNVSGLSTVDDRILEILGRHFNSLTQLNISRCQYTTSLGLIEIAKKCTQLELLRANSCVGVNDDTLTVISQLKGLRVISLGSCHEITDAGIVTMAQGCTQLTSVNLSGCRHLTSVAIRALAQSCPGLMHVDLSGCYQLDDVAFLELTSNCREIVSLDLEDCKLLTDTTLESIAAHLRYLEVLCVSSLENITDSGVIEIVHNCEKLSSLKLDNCLRITDRTVSHIYLYPCKKLKNLEIYDCSNITFTCVRQAKKSLPNVTIKSNFSWREFHRDTSNRGSCAIL
ncbi:hypothetical protein K7432_006481 [Basidiobolus ranarum]|uniref:F-box domain-containing protein n=1 Tax=Basidiobolus ranarum TaxID=34480 RepID=A0ABR2W1I7_9FUNG